ncbi:MAG: hypothetical protein HQK67_09260 [Desulfamplus sp.]|nr:hypothetical protein [Desulfamplus sp.]
MKKVFFYFIMALMFTASSITISGCSNDKKEDDSKKGAVSSEQEAVSSEQGAIKTLTDKVAKEAVSRLNTPIEKARAVKDKQEGDYTDMEKTLKE